MAKRIENPDEPRISNQLIFTGKCVRSMEKKQ
jgi:hypothetical protein